MRHFATLLAVVLCLIPASANAMISPILGPLGAATNAGTRYYSINGGRSVTVAGGISTVQQPVAVDGKVSNLWVKTLAAPGSGKSWTFTLMQNGSPTTLTATVSDTNQSASSTSVVTVAPTDLLAWQMVPTGGPAVSNFDLSATFEGTADGETTIFGGTDAIAGGSTNYMMVYGGQPDGTEANRGATMPAAGTFDRLYFNSAVAPGAGQTYTATLYQNGSPTTLTSTITDTNTVGTPDTTHSVSYSVGDTISVEVVASAGATTGRPLYGLRWRPTTNGETPQFSFDNAFSNITRYHAVNGLGYRAATEDGVQAFVPYDLVAKNFYMNFISGAPTTGTAKTFMLRKNGADAGVVATTTYPATSATDLTHTASYIAGDNMSFKADSTGAPPTTVVLLRSLTTYIAPAGGGGGGGAKPFIGFLRPLFLF